MSFGNTVGNFGTADFSIALWLKTTPSAGSQYILGKRPICENANFFNVSVFPSGVLVFEIDQNGANYLALFGTTAVTDDVWHHAAFVRQGTSLKIYLDGTLEASGTTGGTTDLNNTTDLLLGGGPCPGNFSGLLDDLAIWSGSALSSTEVGQLASSGVNLGSFCGLGFCSGRADGTLCDDGNACTPADFCQLGACAGSSLVDIVNPDFELLYKAGSTTVTSPLFANGGGTFGTSPLATPGPTVTFSDGSSGNVFDVAGWQWNTEMGVTNFNSAFTVPRNMMLFINGAAFGGGTAAKTTTQVLNATLEQAAVYTLTADFGWRLDNGSPTNPPVLRLYAGGTLLTPSVSSSPALIQGSWVTYSRSYSITNPAITGPLKVEVGLGANTDGQQLNIDHVTLTKSVTASQACDDANACTNDSCNPATGCIHTSTVPPETQILRPPNKTTVSWNPATFATQYDALRGSLGAFPVGPGGADEVCFENLPGPTLSDTTVPATGAGFWYLSRGENAGCNGTIGTQGFRGTPGAPRVTTTCP